MTDSRRARKRDQFLAVVRQPPALMGILNVTPDSFSDGGRHIELSAAISRAKTMIAEGASIVDVGGESTRPGHIPVAEDEELRRVAPVIEALARDIDAPISIDTMKAAVAREAARLGASVINDVWGLQRDPAMADVVAETGSAVIVMHNRERTDAAIDILDDVERFLERSLRLAARAGVPFGRILVDPGVGFGKTPEQNCACISNLDRFRRLGAPVLVGLSRKSFIGRIAGGAPDERLIGTLAADVVALMRGASVLRVHDVAEHRQALDVFRTFAATERPPAPRARDGRADVVLALGGNVGDKVGALRRALAALDDEPGIALTAASRLYRTPPWGKTDQDWFANACALARTDLPPEALLDRLKAIETELGRKPGERWGPRVIDIDIIAYDDIALESERLTLPHPEALNRAFVLIPLAEIAPERILGGRRVKEAAANLGAEASGIVPLD
ncbi:dihydropteroate synthase [Roseiarcus sp.]|uniref:dihydropteroate synthase n=1 Tax=Roseiarcus sp. TaxID=1969460 RepID=UPI003F9C3750